MAKREHNKACLANVLEISKARWDKPRLVQLDPIDPPPPLVVADVERPIVEPLGQVSVMKMSCIVPYFDMIDAGKNPLLLDMASEHHPGGGVANGAFAQEEFLCLISNLYPTLQKHADLYPIKDPFILERISFFKDRPTPTNKQCFSQPYVGSVLVSAAFRLSSPQQYDEKAAREMYTRIYKMLCLAQQAGYRNLVLSAFGCGAYHNPPDQIAGIFRYLLLDCRMSSYFEHVIFAVLDDGNNYEIFTKVLHDCTNI